MGVEDVGLGVGDGGANGDGVAGTKMGTRGANCRLCRSVGIDVAKARCERLHDLGQSRFSRGDEDPQRQRFGMNQCTGYTRWYRDRFDFHGLQELRKPHPAEPYRLGNHHQRPPARECHQHFRN